MSGGPEVGGGSAGATPKAKLATSRVKLEIVRTAVITAHNAAGFLIGAGDLQVGRLLRASEAMCRQALILLTADRENEGMDIVKKKKKKAKKKQKEKQDTREQESGGADEEMGAAPVAPLPLAAPGGSVVVGDLAADLGVVGGLLVVPPPAQASASGGACTSSRSSLAPTPAAPARASGGARASSSSTGSEAPTARQVQSQGAAAAAAAAAQPPEVNRSFLDESDRIMGRPVGSTFAALSEGGGGR